jgi:hypothetical protein
MLTVERSRIMALNCSQVAMGDSRRRVWRMGAAVFVVGLFVASWLAPGTPVTRAVFGFVAAASLVFAVELTTEGRQRLLGRERWRIRPQVGKDRLLPAIGHVLLNVFIASSALLTLLQTRHPSSTAMELLRLAAGAALAYAGLALFFEIPGLCLRVAGYSLPLMHRTPIAARSVGEFWGQRWNMFVSAWLRAFIFRPLARRRGAGVGVLGSFLVSGVLHAWPMLVALGTSAAFSVALFFVIQGVFVLAEGRLRIHTWPVPMARTWTVVILLASSPLLIDPNLRLFGL